MDAPPKSRDAHRDRTVRIITIVDMLPALLLLIPAGVVTGNAFPAVGLVPMAFSCLVSATALGSKRQSSYGQFIVPGADFTAATLIMVFMIVRCVSVLVVWKDAGYCL
jgi:hypothetical protein